jgi:hypothetical protein
MFSCSSLDFGQTFKHPPVLPFFSSFFLYPCHCTWSLSALVLVFVFILVLVLLLFLLWSLLVSCFKVAGLFLLSLFLSLSLPLYSSLS